MVSRELSPPCRAWGMNPRQAAVRRIDRAKTEKRFIANLSLI
jgi:hypothetical protein